MEKAGLCPQLISANLPGSMSLVGDTVPWAPPPHLLQGQHQVTESGRPDLTWPLQEAGTS